MDANEKYLVLDFPDCYRCATFKEAETKAKEVNLKTPGECTVIYQACMFIDADGDCEFA